MEHFQLIGCCLKLSRVVRVKPLDFAGPGKEFDRPGAFRLAFVLNRDRGDEARPTVLNVHGNLELMYPLFLTLLVGYKVVCRDDVAPLLGSR